MKKIILSAVIFSFFLISWTLHAETTWVGSVASMPGTFPVDNVMTFDWASSGSGNAEGLASGPQVGDVFTFRYQSYLSALNSPSGEILPLTDELNNQFEYTIVAEFPEIVLNVEGTAAIFSTLSGGVFYIYWDGSPNADVTSGNGFDDGTLIAKGTLLANQISSFLATEPGSGVGSFAIEGLVNYVNPSFLDPSDIFDIRIEGTINEPPGNSTTDAFFLSRSGEGNLTAYGVSGNDTPFKVDASHTFSMEDEEPGTCRVTAGGVKAVEGDAVTFICSFKPNGQIDPKTCATQDNKNIKSAQTYKDTWGGQAGASGVDGNWTHHHSVGPQESFVFHSNEVNEITCSDPGIPCTPAGANATNRQIDFKGIGKFVNQKGFNFPTEEICYTVHLEDIGEPGPGGKWPSSMLPCEHIPGESIDNDSDCMNCQDYYEIRIYGNTDCTGDPIYVNGDASLPSPLGGYFITSGNVQMHPGK